MKKQLLLYFFVIILCFTRAQSQTTELWGMTPEGGEYRAGVIFKTDGNGENQSVVQSFFKNEGSLPNGYLIQASNGKLYGLTRSGGIDGDGVLFEFDLETKSYSKKYDFVSTNGNRPNGSLLLGSNEKFYGMTLYGGTNDLGVIFEFDHETNTYIKKHDFDGENGGLPYGGLIQGSNGKMYGVTSSGGINDDGVLFEFDPETDIYTKKYDFVETEGNVPQENLIQASNGKLYGITANGGLNGLGVIFEFDIEANSYTNKYDFNGIDGRIPRGGLLQASNGKLYGVAAGGLNDYGVLFEFDLDTDTYSKRFDFENSTGRVPSGKLLQALDGKLYGTTTYGGTNNWGIIYNFDVETNIYTVKYNCEYNTGASPRSGLLQANNGKIYGATMQGGGQIVGVIFEFDPDTNVYVKSIDFEGSIEGHKPSSGLVQNTNEMLYGMTNEGGIYSNGVIFELNPLTNTYTKKFDFDGFSGGKPLGDLLLTSSGKMFGTTSLGGDNNKGVIFEFDPITGSYSKKYDFDDVSGVFPMGTLIQASNGEIYGMTFNGGTNGYGVIFEFDPETNTYTKMHDFDEISGRNPRGTLFQASNNKLYGLTNNGGTTFAGVLFEFDPATDVYTVIYEFDGVNSGYPNGSLTEIANGKLYGMTPYLGANGYGVLFEYNLQTNTYSSKFDFDVDIGANPVASLLDASNGNLYGMAGGGVNFKGVLFEFNPETEIYTKKLDFDIANGNNPSSNLIEINTSVLSVAENNLSNSFNVYPNPTQGKLSINLNDFYEDVTITVSNALGQIVQSQNYTDTDKIEFEINGSARLYFLNINSSNGDKASMKIIKN